MTESPKSFKYVLSEIKSDRLSFFALITLVILYFAIIFADFIAPYSANYADMEAASGFYDEDIAVLFPCWYIDGVGGWPGKYYAISVCLPGKTEDEYIDWLTDFGIY